MKLSHRIAIALPMLFLVLPASGHETGAVHDHGVNGLLLLAVLVSGMAAVLRARHKSAISPRPSCMTALRHGSWLFSRRPFEPPAIDPSSLGDVYQHPDSSSRISCSSSAPSRSELSSRTRRSSPTFSRPPRCRADSSFVRSKPV